MTERERERERERVFERAKIEKFAKFRVRKVPVRVSERY